MGGSGPPSKTWFLGPARFLNSNCISISSAVFAGLTCVTDRPTDRPTDHATRWVTIGCIYVRSTAMRPNNKQQWSLQFETTRRRRRLATTRNIKMCLLTSVWHSVWRRSACFPVVVLCPQSRWQYLSTTSSQRLHIAALLLVEQRIWDTPSELRRHVASRDTSR